MAGARRERERGRESTEVRMNFGVGGVDAPPHARGELQVGELVHRTDTRTHHALRRTSQGRNHDGHRQDPGERACGLHGRLCTCLCRAHRLRKGVGDAGRGGDIRCERVSREGKKSGAKPMARVSCEEKLGQPIGPTGLVFAAVAVIHKLRISHATMKYSPLSSAVSLFVSAGLALPPRAPLIIALPLPCPFPFGRLPGP